MSGHAGGWQIAQLQSLIKTLTPMGIWPRNIEHLKRSLDDAGSKYTPDSGDAGSFRRRAKLYTLPVVVEMMWGRLAYLLAECLASMAPFARESLKPSKDPHRLRGSQLTLDIWDAASSTIGGLLPDHTRISSDAVSGECVIDAIAEMCICGLGLKSCGTARTPTYNIRASNATYM